MGETQAVCCYNTHVYHNHSLPLPFYSFLMSYNLLDTQLLLIVLIFYYHFHFYPLLVFTVNVKCVHLIQNRNIICLTISPLTQLPLMVFMLYCLCDFDLLLFSVKCVHLIHDRNYRNFRIVGGVLDTMCASC